MMIISLSMLQGTNVKKEKKKRRREFQFYVQSRFNVKQGSLTMAPGVIWKTSYDFNHNSLSPFQRTVDS